MLPREHQKILKTYLYNKESYHGDVFVSRRLHNRRKYYVPGNYISSIDLLGQTLLQK